MNEILEQIRLVLSGKTMDFIFPPLVFVIVNRFAGLATASAISLAFSLAIILLRFLKKQNFKYATGGFTGTALASGYAFFSGSAAGYFLPSVISGIIFAAALFLSLFMKVPAAAWASHITRNWSLDWYKRKDIRPAYFEVTLFWGFYFGIMSVFRIIFYLGGSAERLAVLSTVNRPLTLIVLILSYIYGIWRLRKMKGPGSDEFEQNLNGPWKGQTKGF